MPKNALQCSKYSHRASNLFKQVLPQNFSDDYMNLRVGLLLTDLTAVTSQPFQTRHCIDFSPCFQLVFNWIQKVLYHVVHTDDELIQVITRTSKKYKFGLLFVNHVASYLGNKLSKIFSTLGLRGLWREPQPLITSGIQLTDQQSYQFTLTPVSIGNLFHYSRMLKWDPFKYMFCCYCINWYGTWYFCSLASSTKLTN